VVEKHLIGQLRVRAATDYRKCSRGTGITRNGCKHPLLWVLVPERCGCIWAAKVQGESLVVTGQKGRDWRNRRDKGVTGVTGVTSVLILA
jgi:hypothetical protein